jgi:hypothetical protein
MSPGTDHASSHPKTDLSTRIKSACVPFSRDHSNDDAREAFFTVGATIAEKEHLKLSRIFTRYAHKGYHSARVPLVTETVDEVIGLGRHQ